MIKKIKNKLKKIAKNKLEKSIKDDIKSNYKAVLDIDPIGLMYNENKPIGSENFKVKMDRKNSGKDFEWPNMIALNQAIACFIGDAKKIVNIGSGTGTFEWFASVDKSLSFIASEFDLDCVEWCKNNRQRDNIQYCSFDMKELLNKYKKFDLAVTVDVIEHVGNYPEFLREFSQLADRAIITTPNKARTKKTLIASSPEYYQHVREWTASELYWVLKCFYKEVEMYGMPDIYSPEVKSIGFFSTLTPLIAVCKK